MRLLLVGLLTLGLALPVLAGDYSGKTIRAWTTCLKLDRILIFTIRFITTQEDLPKPNDKTGKPAAKDDWTGYKVLPKKQEAEIRIGDWVDGKQVFWAAHNLLNCIVRDERGGFLRVFDGRREGWVRKDDFLPIQDSIIYWTQVLDANPRDKRALYMRGYSWRDSGKYDNAISDFTALVLLERPYGKESSGEPRILSV